MLKVKICNILLKQKKYAPNSLYAAKYMKMFQKINKMLEKCWGEKLVIFALDLKLDLGTETLVLTSAPKFLWFVLHFNK